MKSPHPANRTGGKGRAGLTLAAALTALTALVAAAATQAQSSPWYAGAALGLAHDSNTYRLIDGASLPANLTRGDTLTTATLMAGLDQPIGRQRIFGSASVRNNRYSHNSALDNTGYGLNLGLDWTSIERLSGRVSLQTNRDLALFNPEKDVPTLLRKNTARSQQIDASLRLGLVSLWQAEATLGWRNLAHSADEYRSREFSQASGSIGLRWRPSAGLSLGTALRLADGRYPHYLRLPAGAELADRFRRQDLDLSADWNVSGASALSARLSSGRMRFTEATQRNFNGLTGELRWTWRPTAKIAVATTLLRETGQDLTLGPSLIVSGTDTSRATNMLRVHADYEPSSKIKLQLSASTARRSLADVSSTIFGTRQVTTGADSSLSLGLGARWTPTRAIQLSCTVNHERRSADGRLSSPYGVDGFGCSGQFLIQ